MMVMRALCSSTCGTPAAVATLVAPRLGGVCAFSAGAQTVTDQMIAYAMQQFKVCTRPGCSPQHTVLLRDPTIARARYAA